MTWHTKPGWPPTRRAPDESYRRPREDDAPLEPEPDEPMPIPCTCPEGFHTPGEGCEADE